jgi:hypothetical protein
MLDIYDDTKAFCLRDVTWQLAEGTRLEGAQCLAHFRSDIRKGWLRWRTQKNGDNGNQCMFTQLDKATYSGINFLYGIVKRFVALRGLTDFTAPLSVYRAPTVFRSPAYRCQRGSCHAPSCSKSV